jgi:hypothetical protein
MPTAHDRRRAQRDGVDRDLVRRAATWLREDPARAAHAGLADEADVAALAALLDVLAAAVPHLHAGVRRQVVDACRLVLDETMADPRRRRTRRR